MPIITRTGQAVEPQSWQQILAASVRNRQQLLERLQLSHAFPADPASDAAEQQFPLLVPEPFIERMTVADAQDPLLLQVLSQSTESELQPGYVLDPLEEKHSNINPGIIHKYAGRVLLITTSGCAVNCRYCFRRHFPYQDNRVGRQQWQPTLDYIRQDDSIHEVILSGGDPLMLQDKALQQLLEQIEAISHVSTVRIHTRLPVVIPQRLTPELQQLLSNTRLQVVLVLHINHANELAEAHRSSLTQLRHSGITLLNQTVLLKGVNDDVSRLADLSKRLFEFGILPYYLHLLDPVQGAHHFDLQGEQALHLHKQLLAQLPGYLVPKLVREEAGKQNKTPQM